MNRIMRELLNTAIYLLCVLGAVWLVITFVGQRTEVEGASMENTLHNGDNLIVDKLSYRFHDPERFDIIVFPFQFQDNTYYIKRIIGLPGETVQIMDDGSIYINGEKLEENYGMEVIKPETIGRAAESGCGCRAALRIGIFRRKGAYPRRYAPFLRSCGGRTISSPARQPPRRPP